MTRGRKLTHHAIYVCYAACLLACLNGCGLFAAEGPLFTARGRIVDAESRAVAGAVVTDGRSSVLTDEGGRFAFPVFDRALAVAKPGFSTARFLAADVVEGDVSLEASRRAERVALDGRWAESALSGLREALAEHAGTLAAYPGVPLSKLEVLVMVTPGVIPASERAAIGGWVRAGGRLVLCGEWGGFPEQDLGTLDDLAAPAGLSFTGGTVKTLGDDLSLSVARATPGSLARLMGEEPVTLYAASDVALAGAARPILASGSRAYAVLATGGSPVLAGVGPSGLGKVFAIGDSSLWRDADSEGRGVPNVRHGGNARLVAAILGW